MWPLGIVPAALSSDQNLIGFETQPLCEVHKEVRTAIAIEIGLE